MNKFNNRKNYESISHVFKDLNASGLRYLVMRNYEALTQDSLFVDGHEDIDLLCDNHRLAVKTLGAVPIYLFPHRNSYTIKLKNTDVQVDIRFLGDGYYDFEWQKEMLRRKIEYTKNIFTMDSENLFYSLIFHAAFHKHNMSEDYLSKLTNMAKELNVSASCEEELINILFSFMIEKGYKATITRDPGIILNYSKIPKNLIRRDLVRNIKRRVLRLGKYQP